jgi:hypothetical protein
VVGSTYRVYVVFDLSRAPYAEQGKGLQHFARFLPDSAHVQSAQAPPTDGGGLYTIDVSLPAPSAAQALRDVARAIELTASEVAPEILGEVQRATIERQPE